VTVRDHPLHRLPRYGDGIGLHRVRFLMEACGVDGAEVGRRAIAVTGSNGKGSTARIAAELLHASQPEAAVGLFTSPHLYRYNERFRIDGEPVTDQALGAAMDEVARAVGAWRADHTDAVGAFEAQFVVALVLFRACRWLVLEAGIGGRYDPVRLARAPVAGLVSLDLEHTELLGTTLLEIALDKLDATAPGGTAVLGETCAPFAEPLRTVAELSQLRLQFVDPHAWSDTGVACGLQHFAIGEFGGLRSPLIGRHQFNNHAVAIALVRERLARSDKPLRTERWPEAIARVTWPGRLETISEDPRVVIDVGHTPEGVRAALAGFRALQASMSDSAPPLHRFAVLVTGGSKNKPVREMLEILAPGFACILCTAAHHNGRDAGEVEAIVKAVNPDAATILCPSIADAVRTARAQNRPVYAAGGLFLAAEFAHVWRGGAAEDLHFF